MKTKRKTGGRKIATAGKLIDPATSFSMNRAIAALGEFGTDSNWPYFVIAGAAFKCEQDVRTAGGVISEKMKQGRQHLAWSLYERVAPAFAELDPKPFRMFAEVIELMQDLGRTGPRLPDHFEILRLAENLEWEQGPDALHGMTAKEFRSRLRRSVSQKQFSRITNLLRLPLKKSVGGRPPKTPDNSSSPVS